MPRASSAASTKASIGLRTQAASFTAGAGGRTGARKAQCFAADVATGVSGQAAPASIQRRRISTSAAVSRSPFGGITSSGSRPATRRNISLSCALPGTSAGPESPPASAAARRSRRSPALCLSGPWH